MNDVHATTRAELTRADLRKIMDLAHQLNDVTTVRQLRQTIMEALGRLIGGNLVGLNEIALPGFRSIVRYWPEEPSIDDLNERVSAYLHLHPTACYYFDTAADFLPTMVSDHVTPVRWRESPAYQEIFVPIDAVHQLTIPLFPDVGVQRADAYAINREAGTDFSERDRAVAAALQPLLVSAHRRLAHHGGDGLTERQVDILRRLGTGQTQEAVARSLRVSRTIIKRELAACNVKLGTVNVTSAVAKAAHLGIITP
ncbi:ATP-dependent transcriptional regulator [Frankia sp. QA3]|nr:ATP-dependent transcriptional regulator [Frankia sp. QA3]